MTNRNIEKPRKGMHLCQILHTVWLGSEVSVLEFGAMPVLRSDDTQHFCECLLQNNMIPLHGSSHS